MCLVESFKKFTKQHLRLRVLTCPLENCLCNSGSASRAPDPSSQVCLTRGLNHKKGKNMNVDCGIPRILKGTDGHLLTAPSPESGSNVQNTISSSASPPAAQPGSQAPLGLLRPARRPRAPPREVGILFSTRGPTVRHTTSACHHPTVDPKA